MRRTILVSTAVLWTIFLAVGCGGSGSQAHKGHHAPDEGHAEDHNAKLALSSEGDSGVSATAAFEDGSEGVRVELKLRNLPEPDTLYLAHIHPGTCAQGGEGESHGAHHEHGEHHEEEEGQAHEHGEQGEHAEEPKGHEHDEEIEYPLSQVESDSEGDGSSTTTLEHTTVEKLFSGGAKHVNVHEAGSGDPPILACADLKGAV